MNRKPYFEVVRRDDGWLARLRGGNGHKVFTSELYTRKRAAERAVTIFAEAAWGNWPEIILDQHDGLGAYVWEEASGASISVRYEDERTPPLPPPVIEPPFYVRDVRGEPFWHDSDYHWRHCLGDECTEGAPTFGTEIRGRTGSVVFGRGGAS